MAVFRLQLNSRIVTMLLCSLFCVQLCCALGINYGQITDNLPSPEQVRSLLTSLRISKIRIYNTNPHVLATFVGIGIELIVTVPNDAVALFADPQQALQWLTSDVRPFVPTTRITDIAVGNEIFTGNDPALISNLVPAMLALRFALAELGLDSSIHVSTANFLAE